MNHFKENLKELRIENNYSQYKIAAILNITQSDYNHYERGRREPNIDMLIKMAILFKVSLDELIL
jgi:transcriptional regulator with XRE-family HTH domain